MTIQFSCSMLTCVQQTFNTLIDKIEETDDKIEEIDDEIGETDSQDVLKLRKGPI